MSPLFHLRLLILVLMGIGLSGLPRAGWAQDASTETGWQCDPPLVTLMPSEASRTASLSKSVAEEAMPQSAAGAAYDYPVASGPLGISPFVWGAVLGPAGVITVNQKVDEHRATRRAVLGAITGAAIYGTLYFVIGSVSR